jgi:hypothetical protein
MLYVPSLFIFKFQSFMRGFGVTKSFLPLLNSSPPSEDFAKLKAKKYLRRKTKGRSCLSMSGDNGGHHSHPPQGGVIYL